MIRLAGDNVSRMLEQQWLENVRNGCVYVPGFVSDEWSQLITMTLRGLRDVQRIEFIIDCDKGGYNNCFDPCREILWRNGNGKETSAVVVGKAASIGLSYCVACTHRSAYSDAEFMWHGEMIRAGEKHESGVYLEDHYAADWMARFTNRTYDEWAEFASDGRYHEFGPEQALEWGVIDEIQEVV